MEHQNRYILIYLQQQKVVWTSRFKFFRNIAKKDERNITIYYSAATPNFKQRDPVLWPFISRKNLKNLS